MARTDAHFQIGLPWKTSEDGLGVFDVNLDFDGSADTGDRRGYGEVPLGIDPPAEPAGGALVFIEQVDRAWSYSLLWSGRATWLRARVHRASGPRLVVLALVVGAGDLAARFYARGNFRKRIDPCELSSLRTPDNDTRSYVVIGDPAVRATGG